MPKNYELSPYPIPQNYLPEDDTCFVVFVPNDPVYRKVFFAQWDELTKWLSWEKGESKRAREVAQRFKRRFPRPISCDVVNELDDEGNMTITVNTNVTCGGCGTSGPTTIYCYNDDGTVTVAPQQVPPADPQLPEDWDSLPLDPAGTPPPNMADWSEFDSLACFSANVVWWYAHTVLRLAETYVDILATLAIAVAILIPLLPAGVVAAIGGATLLDVLWQIVQILTSEQASDIINELTDWMEEEKESIVCSIFSNRHNYGKEHVLGIATDGISAVKQAVNVDETERTTIEKLLVGLYDFGLFWFTLSTKASDIVPDAGWTEFPPVDCASCSTASNFIISDDFSTDNTGGFGWYDDRGTVLDGSFKMSASDIAQGKLRLNANLLAYWAMAPGLVDNLRIKFNWRVVDRGLGTVGFTMQVKRNSPASTPEMGGLSAYVDSVPIGQWQSFDKVIPFTVAVNGDNGTNIFFWQVTTNDELIQVEMDNIQITGTYQ